MKRILKLSILFTVIFSLLLSSVSCVDNAPKPEKEGFVKYSDLGITFWLPEDMDQKNVQYAAIFFTNREADFLVNVLESETVSDNWYLREGFNVEDYTSRFIVENNYKCDYDYDAEKNVATFGVHYPIYETDEEDPEYYYHYITIVDSVVYVVIMSCKEEYFDKYESQFLEWTTYFSIG